MRHRGPWSITVRSTPGTPRVRVSFRRLWYFPLLGRVRTEGLDAEGEQWVPVVSWALADGCRGAARRLLEHGFALFPGTVEAAVAHVFATTPALVFWHEGAVPVPGTPPGAIPASWLRRRAEPREVERVAAEWTGLEALRRPGDELWWFESPPASWEALHGRAGWALVRDGVPREAYVTRLN